MKGAVCAVLVGLVSGAMPVPGKSIDLSSIQRMLLRTLATVSGAAADQSRESLELLRTCSSKP